MMDAIALPATLQSATIVPQSSGDADDRLIELWLHGRPKNTVLAYRRDVALMRRFVAKPIERVTLADLQAFADAVAGEPATRKRVLSATKSLLRFLARAGLLKFDVGAALRVPKARDALADRIITRAEMKKLLRAGKTPRNAAILRLFYETGARREEISKLRRRDVVAGEGCGFITVTGKGEKTRTVRVGAETYEAVIAVAGGGDLDGRIFELSPSQLWRIVRASARRAGIAKDVSPHFLRHAHASHALDRGAPVALVRDTLGHSSVAVTDRYLHARPGESSGKYLGL